MPVQSYAATMSTRRTPQTQPVSGRRMVENSAGGFGFQIDDFSRLDRFLILGNEGGTYYASEQTLTRENAERVLCCASTDCIRAVDRIVEISDSGRAPKNDPAVFALALIVGLGEPAARRYALDQLSKVCRIGTHLFQFVQAVREFRGFGRALRRGIGRWYTDKTDDDLAYQLVKYQQREGMSHRDVLRLCHVGQNTPTFRFAAGLGLGSRHVLRKKKERTDEYAEVQGRMPAIVEGFEAVKRASSVHEVVSLINRYNLPRECIPTQFLNDTTVWNALLDRMPMTAMIRNLGKMTSIGLLAPMNNGTSKVVTELSNIEKLHKSRVHPITLLSALRTYAQGHGERGKLIWTPVQRIVDALDTAFYTAFDNVEPTNKRWLIGCDVSDSMDGGEIAGCPGLTPRVATGALALVTASVEPQHYIIGFTSGHAGHHYGVTPIDISPRQRLDSVIRKMSRLPMGATDCALPVLHALEKQIEVDAFVVLTDNESFDGDIHVFQALERYKREMGIDAKLIACAMTATEYSIADPNNPNMLDVVGFDTATPQLMAEFVRG